MYSNGMFYHQSHNWRSNRPYRASLTYLYYTNSLRIISVQSYMVWHIVRSKDKGEPKRLSCICLVDCESNHDVRSIMCMVWHNGRSMSKVIMSLLQKVGWMLASNNMNNHTVDVKRFVELNIKFLLTYFHAALAKSAYCLV